LVVQCNSQFAREVCTLCLAQSDARILDRVLRKSWAKAFYFGEEKFVVRCNEQWDYWFIFNEGFC